MQLACPRDRGPLDRTDGRLRCPDGHDYPVVDDIPVLLLADEAPTHPSCVTSLEDAALRRSQPDTAPGIDPFVQEVVVGTCGCFYRHLVGRLETYPIPDLRLPRSDGARFLEIGCNWGRWCVAARRKGYSVVGIDPSLDAIRAARRVASQLGIEADYVVGDGRHAPFDDESFDVVFSYSVLQHLRKDDVLAVLDEVRRVLRPGGVALIQMPNSFGLRNLYLQARRRRFREPIGQRTVRYWTPRELRSVFTERIGQTTLFVDGFFSLNAQATDLDLMPRRHRAVIRVSDLLRRAAGRLSALGVFADSLYVRSLRA